ncbi:hypothetical protein [Treponema sp.]|uniref:hypothetical protein n=1 Tax=Treponema sp. TaxID=166 RepID=UPI00388FACCA
MKRIFSISLFQISIFLLSGCHNLLQDKVVKSTDSVASLSNLLVTEETAAELEAPAQIFASEHLSTNQIFVSWSEVENRRYFQLERAVVTVKNADGSFTEPDESEYEIVNKYVYGTSYTDTILEEPKYSSEEYNYAYFYRVCAENPVYGYDSSEFAVSEAGTLFAPVTQVSASQGESTSEITVSWGKVDNVSSYKIYRSTSSDGANSQLIASVLPNQSKYSNAVSSSEQGVDFYYTVYAANEHGTVSVASPAAYGYSAVEGAPGRVTEVKVTEGRGETINSISISWKAVSGESQVYYTVYRTSSTDSSSVLLKDGLTVTSYTDTKSLSANVYYYYQVLAYCYDSDGTTKMKGPVSESSAADENPAEGFILSAPASISVAHSTESDGKCTVTFPAGLGSKDCPSDSGLSELYNTYSYRIYTSSSQNEGFTNYVEFSDSALTAEDGYYSVEVDFAKFYKISTYNSAVPLESTLSSVAAPSPYAAQNAQASKHAYIENYTVSGKENSNGVYPVKITWEESDGGAEGGYYIYRSTKEASGFKKITDEPVTGTSYIDETNTTAKPGVYYYYKVLALNSLSQGSNFSEVSVGYGALTYDQYMREYNKTIKRSHQKFTLMHKASTSALGSESISGELAGSASYKAEMDGLGARIIMYYSGYADYYINSNPSLGYYFKCTGNTNTSANMSANGSMDGTVTCEGMYPGTVGYDNIKIAGGGAGGGYYVITPEGFSSGNVSWTVGEE